jgi:pimeloyl-ACP methyl ester carboxylesterase
MQTLSRDGVRLAYTESGSGDPPMLLVHGWSCDHTYFAPQFAHFSTNHRVVAVDLRGHGESDKPVQEYSMAGFAADLRWLCEQLGLERPVVVGHSMGGVIAFEMAARYPEHVGAVVAVDTPLVPAPELVTRLNGVAEGLRGPEYQHVAQQFVQGMFVPADDQERKARIVAGMAAAPQHVMVSAMECVIGCDMAASVAGCIAPALLINARPRTDPALLTQLCPQIMIGQTVGAGHFNQLEVPDQVNAMIERFMVVSL